MLDSYEFGNSWVASPDVCNELPTEDTDPCASNPSAVEEAQQLCRKIIDEDGEYKSMIFFV